MTLPCETRSSGPPAGGDAPKYDVRIHGLPRGGGTRARKRRVDLPQALTAFSANDAPPASTDALRRDVVEPSRQHDAMVLSINGRTVAARSDGDPSTTSTSSSSCSSTMEDRKRPEGWRAGFDGKGHVHWQYREVE